MLKAETLQIVALGANVSSFAGAPAATLHAALGALAQSGFVIRAVSRFFRTPCFPKGAGPDYVNAAVCLRSGPDVGQSAHAVLAQLHRIEAGFGRERVQRWGQRTLDLDLLAMGDQVLPDVAEFTRWHGLDPDLQAKAAPDQLILPHPRLQDRAFVLVPMLDIAPQWRHPVLGLTVAQMVAQLPEQDRRDITVI